MRTELWAGRNQKSYNAIKDREDKIRWVICNMDSGDYIPMKHIDGYTYLTRKPDSYLYLEGGTVVKE